MHRPFREKTTAAPRGNLILVEQLPQLFLNAGPSVFAQECEHQTVEMPSSSSSNVCAKMIARSPSRCSEKRIPSPGASSLSNVTARAGISRPPTTISFRTPRFRKVFGRRKRRRCVIVAKSRSGGLPPPSPSAEGERPPLANTRPGNPAPAMGPGTAHAVEHKGRVKRPLVSDVSAIRSQSGIQKLISCPALKIVEAHRKSRSRWHNNRLRCREPEKVPA